MPLFGKKKEKSDKKEKARLSAPPRLPSSTIPMEITPSASSLSLQLSSSSTTSQTVHYKETRSVSYTNEIISGNKKQINTFQTNSGTFNKPLDSFITGSPIRSSLRSLPDVKQIATSWGVTTDAKPYVPVYTRTANNQYVPSYLVNSNNNNNVASSTSTPSSSSSLVNNSNGMPAASGAQPKKLTVKVKKSAKGYQIEKNPIVPTYVTNSKKRGRALIVNNMKFVKGEYRHGAELDEINISELFRQMGFEVTVERNLKSQQMKKAVDKFATSKSWATVDICVVVIMSHGNSAAGNTHVLCSDEATIQTDEVIAKFSAKNCVHLHQKPKIFIFQCCRGENRDQIATDATPFFVPREYQDMLIAHSTVPGYASHRDPTTGTWYVQTLCEVFSEHAHSLDVESMLKIVDQKLACIGHPTLRQTSSYESRGFKKCYFHP